MLYSEDLIQDLTVDANAIAYSSYALTIAKLQNFISLYLLTSHPI